ncbi:phosphatase impl1 chloroplastic [Phtheirospermum japonicum]|uniref:Phosphatase impl1 chloroplastic n=1 Tax=Phtheirospermum japonicum TaxID=374723 RepID=A0A830CTK9_9LAMI|nr:phosphatase impl1 chloroplastic [Phtheirospermum japonicum]
MVVDDAGDGLDQAPAKATTNWSNDLCRHGASCIQDPNSTATVLWDDVAAIEVGLIEFQAYAVAEDGLRSSEPQKNSFFEQISDDDDDHYLFGRIYVILRFRFSILCSVQKVAFLRLPCTYMVESAKGSFLAIIMHICGGELLVKWTFIVFRVEHGDDTAIFRICYLTAYFIERSVKNHKGKPATANVVEFVGGPKCLNTRNFAATTGKGTFCNGEIIQGSQTDKIEQSLLVTRFGNDHDDACVTRLGVAAVDMKWD